MNATSRSTIALLTLMGASSGPVATLNVQHWLLEAKPE
jgi:hypothetical protein